MLEQTSTQPISHVFKLPLVSYLGCRRRPEDLYHICHPVLDFLTTFHTSSSSEIKKRPSQVPISYFFSCCYISIACQKPNIFDCPAFAFALGEASASFDDCEETSSNVKRMGRVQACMILEKGVRAPSCG